MVETREDTRRDGPCNSRTKTHDAAMNSVCSHTPRARHEDWTDRRSAGQAGLACLRELEALWKCVRYTQ